MHYKLTPEQLTRLQAWLQANWTPPPPCPDCGGFKWQTESGMSDISFIRTENNPITHHVSRVIMFRCLDCQHLQLANAMDLLAIPDR